MHIFEKEKSFLRKNKQNDSMQMFVIPSYACTKITFLPRRGSGVTSTARMMGAIRRLKSPLNWCSLVFISVPLVFHWCSIGCFIGIHWCSMVFHWCSLLFISVPLVFYWIFHWYSLVFNCVPLVLIAVHWCSLAFIGVHWCSTGVHWRSLVFHWCSIGCFIGIHWCSIVFHWCSLLFISVPLVFIGVH